MRKASEGGREEWGAAELSGSAGRRHRLAPGHASYGLDDALRGQHTGDAGTGEGSDDAGHEGRQGDLGDVAAPVRRDLRQHANLRAQGADVAETLSHISHPRGSPKDCLGD